MMSWPILCVVFFNVLVSSAYEVHEDSLVCTGSFRQDILPGLLQWRSTHILAIEGSAAGGVATFDGAAALARRCSVNEVARLSRIKRNTSGAHIECPQGILLLALFCKDVSTSDELCMWHEFIARWASIWTAMGMTVFSPGMWSKPASACTDVGLSVSEVAYNLDDPFSFDFVDRSQPTFSLPSFRCPDVVVPWTAWRPSSAHPSHPLVAEFSASDVNTAFVDLERLLKQYWQPPPGPTMADCRGSDQDCRSGGHCYTPAYAKAFAPRRATASALLLMGLCRGSSAAALAEFFPAAQIFGVDIDLTPFNLSDFHTRLGLAKSAADRIHAFRGDSKLPAGTPGGLPLELGQVDIAIDDTDHAAATIIGSFKNVFFRHLRPGGLYVIEDAEVSFRVLQPFFARLQQAAMFRAPWADHRPGGPGLFNKRLAVAWDPLDAWVESVRFSHNLVLVTKRRGIEDVDGRLWTGLAGFSRT